jgi:primary-amine oxidase
VLDPLLDGQLPIIDTEFEMVEQIVNDPRGHDALERCGIDPASVRAIPLSAGSDDYPEERGRRVLRTLGFQQRHEKDHPWAHPVDGLCAYVDLTGRTVLRVIDNADLLGRPSRGNFDEPVQVGLHRTDLKRIEITQPEGPSFTVDGNLVRWQHRALRVGFNEREGLTLHQIGFAGRPVLYRVSVAEMAVPVPVPRRRFGFGRTTSTSASTCSPATPTRWRWAATAWARSATSTPRSPTTSASLTARYRPDRLG